MPQDVLAGLVYGTVAGGQDARLELSPQ